MGASFLLVVTLAIASWFYIERGTYTTGIGEQRSLILADGSTVELNARSRIRVRYMEHERRIIPGARQM
jgi:transmembrane sensor